MHSPVKRFCSFLLLLFVALIQCSAHARPISDDKRQLIDQIMQQTGTNNALALMTNQLAGEILNILQVKKVAIDRPLIALVQQESKTVMYEEFVLTNRFNEIFYELYDEYFSTEQLKDIVQFYDSSAGKKLLGAMPEISRRSMELAKEHSKGIGSKVQQRLMKRFDELEQKNESSEK